jgi:hypothetical protein
MKICVLCCQEFAVNLRITVLRVFPNSSVAISAAWIQRLNLKILSDIFICIYPLMCLLVGCLCEDIFIFCLRQGSLLGPMDAPEYGQSYRRQFLKDNIRFVNSVVHNVYVK